MSTDVQMEDSSNIVWHQHHVAKQQRAQQKNQTPCVLWFTGLSGAGKSTVAGALENRLVELGYHTYLLDGDNVRHGLCRDLGFSSQDRRENIRRIGEVANLMVDAGLIVLSAFISPHREEREMVRDLVGDDAFFEVYVDTSLAECEKRDPKGLYKKARAGEISQFTGIDSEYQIPLKPEIHLNAGEQTVAESVEACIKALKRHNVIS
ncbi:adenylyl-sulfate kinase [Photobacterium sanguinicancri]|uniref:Adenylyl-sulfate kinase n=1 Tax=Photobacterium sanguinicancri TaxID=875932 RepID=A0AAW7Y9P4_9GAMM|nr:adenylyl-sulfate kinase [Photobacterium sanguinicancri]KXI21624.1 adenylyl-sulfate kinase [Photobacterium sanguinicancri]MDO6544635.1 adenylyl-sulfate kinase [Photobacterium sanguinicancri]